MEQVDTLTLQTIFKNNTNRIDIADKITLKTQKNYNEERQEYYYTGKYKGYSFYYNTRHYCLTVTIQHKLIINKTDKQIEQETINMLNDYFKIDFKKLGMEKLNRIDYKQDKTLKDKELTIIKNIFNKTKNKVGKSYKKEVTEKDGFYKVKYTSKNSGYVEVICYDKGNEMLKLLEEGKVTQEEANKYKNTFRIEVRLKNGRLNYEQKQNGTEKTMSNYYDKDMANIFFKENIAKILGKEKIYRIDVAIKKIQDSTRISNSMKNKLIKLIEDVNKNGYTKTEKHYSESTFREHKKKIESLGINILTFDEVIDGQAIDIESIENFGMIQQ